MTGNLIAQIESEIERMLRRCDPWLRDVPARRRLSVRWTLSGKALRWHVALEDVLEPDVDIEITADGLVVRARTLRDDAPLCVALLPVPSGFDANRPRIRYETGYLEVRVLRVARRGGGR